jgi:uncharacterized membrane protein
MKFANATAAVSANWPTTGWHLKRHALEATLIILCVGSAAYAHDAHAPGFYAVHGVARGEILNVRSTLSVTGDDVGDLRAEIAPVEILEIDAAGSWGRLLWHGIDAWVLMRYLAPTEVPLVAGTPIPAGLICNGTEPFWSLLISEAGLLRLSTTGANALSTMTLTTTVATPNAGAFPLALLARDDASELTAILHHRQCQDGMSDLTYGWSIDILQRPAAD